MNINISFIPPLSYLPLSIHATRHDNESQPIITQCCPHHHITIQYQHPFNINPIPHPIGKKAKAIYSFLQKDKVYKGIVEHVFTGSRYKVTIPSENVCLQLALAQVRCPNLAKAAGAGASKASAVDAAANNAAAADGDDETKGEVDAGAAAGATAITVDEVEEVDPLAVWAEAAKKYSRYNVLQRHVEVEINDVDRNGIMLGKLYVSEKPSAAVVVRGGLQKAAGPSQTGVSSFPYSISLVTEGLASVDRYVTRYKHTYLYTYLHTHMHTHIHIHTYI
jgi:hypothetical protein